VLFIPIVLAACSNEAEALQERIDTLETENAGLQSAISTLTTDLERSRAEHANTQNELQQLISAIAAEAEANGQGADGNQSGPLAITYGGEPNNDMTWPLSYGLLQLGLRLNLNEPDEDDEIVWSSANEDIFTIVSSEDGMTATATPKATGSAQVIVTVGDQETRSWVRIT